MIVPAVIYLLCLGVIAGALIGPEHHFGGRAAAVVALALAASGTVLAVGAL